MLHIENILLPGRHHILTNFQHQYIEEKVTKQQTVDLFGQDLQIMHQPNLIFAVTSANHKNTRRNPVPSNRREQAIEAFCEDLPVKGFSYPIDDIGNSNKFADFTIKEISVQSRGQFNINPTNTAVICSTPSVITLYKNLGYPILPAELKDIENNGKYNHKRPWDIILAMVDAGVNWRNDPAYIQEVHASSRQILQKYHLGDLIIELHNDPLLGNEGDITETRDYETYREAFEHGAQRKYEIVKPYIKSGRIIDIGCATGEIIKLMSQDDSLAESDLYGIEASRHLFNICQQRREKGDFANENTFFYQRNFMTGNIFPDNSVNTTTTFSLSHEIESYLGHEALQKFIKKIYDMTASGGVYINSDVIGPDDKDLIVVMKLSTKNGQVESWQEIDESPSLSQQEFDKLSTLGRFRRFSRDFRASENEKIEFKQLDELGEEYVELRLADACEFLSKKDYTDSWYSEMHERFCFWNYQDWVNAVEAAGFKVSEVSHAYKNDWIIENRFKGQAELFNRENSELKPLDYPVTNMLLVADKQM